MPALKPLRNAIVLAGLTIPMYAGITGTAAAATTGGDDAGQVAFNTHCRNCHSVKPDDNRLGPTLHNIFGAPAGQAKDFPNYSGSLTPDITWDEATLDKFIADPKSIASNTTMTPFSGVPDAEQRKLIIDYLKAQSES